MNDEGPKITECWTWEEESRAPNMYMCSFEPNPDEYEVRNKFNRPAILMWRDDYDAMLRELEELRAENERLLDAYASEKLLNGAVAGSPMKLFSK